jgi:hypothetical protein
VEDPIAREEFCRTKRALRIFRPVRLYQSGAVYVPMVEGIVRSRVILPPHAYTSEELRVIFYHELSHVKSWDTFFILCGFLGDCESLCMTGERRIFDRMRDLLEDDCDYRAVAAMERTHALPAAGGRTTLQRYYEIVLAMIPEQTRARSMRLSALSLVLGESGNKLEERIDYVQASRASSVCDRIPGGIKVCCFLLCCIAAAYCAGGLCYAKMWCERRLLGF